MALSEELLIIIIVVALGVALLLTIIMAVYFCYCRRRVLTQQQPAGSPHNPHTSHAHHTVLPRNDASSGGGGKMRLDKLPTAAETKRMEEGYTFTGESQMNGGNTQSDDTANYIMGPSVDQAERHEGGVQNDGFMMGENQMDSAAYLRGGVDPADVAEVYMEDDVLQEAARARRKQQLEVRRKASKNNSKKRAEAQKNLQEVRKQSSREGHHGSDRDRDRERDNSRHGHRSSDKHRQPRS